jgi:hypothetical protein
MTHPKAIGLAEPEAEEDILKRYEHFYQQVITIVGLLGGFTFAGLVLVLGNQSFILNSSVFHWTPNPLRASPEQYVQIVAVYFATVSVFSSIVAFISLRALTMRFRSLRGRRRMYRVVNLCAGIVYSSFVGALYLLLGPLNPWLSVLSAVVATVSLVILTSILLRARELE